MGTVVTITVLDSDLSHGNRAIESAYRAIEGVENSMSTYRPESEISRLNREGTIEASEELLWVIGHAEGMRVGSHDAFDITVKPLLDLYAASFADRDGPPSDEEIGAMLARVGPEGLSIEGSRVTLKPGTTITLDGIAKGYAIDQAIEALRGEGIEHALVDAGGDVRVIGDKNGEPWRVAMQNPRDPADYLMVIELVDGAVATSGDYRRYFDPEMTYHHIVDPRSGRCAEELISVSVRAETAMGADGIATALFVLGADWKSGVGNLVEGEDGVEAFAVTDDRRILKSSGW